MSRPSLAAGFALGLACSAGLATASQLSPIDLVAQLIGHAHQQTRTLDLLVSEVARPDLRAQLRHTVRAIDADLVQASQSVRSERYRLSSRPKVRVTGEHDLVDMIAALEDTAFGSRRLDLLADMMQGRHVTSQQVTRIMAVFDFDHRKVEAAAMLYPLVVDPQDWWTVYGVLTFPSSRDDLRARVSG